MRADATLRSEIDHVNVSSQAPVVSEIVSGVIRILVNGDGIAVPVPIRYICPVNGCNLEVITVEPEALTAAARNMEYMSRSEPEPELTVGERVIDVRNMLMLDPLFSFHVRSGSGDRASVGDSAAVLWPGALRFATSLRPCSLWRSGMGLGPRLRRATGRTMLGKVLPARLPSMLCPFPIMSFLRIQAWSHVSKDTH